MSHTPTGPDVTAPATYTRLFRSSPTRFALIVLIAAMPVTALVSLGIELLDGATMSWQQTAASVLDVLPYVIVVALVAVWQLGRRRTWVRFSSGGMEPAAHGGDPVLLDWSEIVSARVRRRWLWAILEVVPVDLDAVRSVDPGRDLPQMREAGRRRVRCPSRIIRRRRRHAQESYRTRRTAPCPARRPPQRAFC